MMEGSRHNGIFLNRIFDVTHNTITHANINHKGKAILVTGHEGPLCCETSRIPHFLDNRLTDSGKNPSLKRRPPFTPQEDSWYSFLLEAESTLRRLKKSSDLIGYRTRNFPACRIVTKPITPQRAPKSITDRPNKEYLFFYSVHLKNLRPVSETQWSE
jgi:hypothetical protein